MPAHVLHGDSFLVPQALKRLTADAGVEGLLEGNRHNLQGGQVKPQELFSICNALPFMDTGRLVVVDGLLSTQERRPGRNRERSGDSGQGESARGGWDKLAQVVPGMPETTFLVFTDGLITDSNPLLRLLKPVAQIQSLAAPTGEGLSRWIKEASQQKSAGISPAAIKRLSDLVGNDLWTLDGELEKLSLYASGRRIEESDVEELVAQVREASIFAAVDAMIDGRPGLALRLLRQLRQDGREVSYIIAMVERQLRLLALTRDSLDNGTSQKDLGRLLGVSSQFVLRKTLDQARRLSRQAVAARYRRLLEADLAIKQGNLEPDLALELLAAEQSPPVEDRVAT